MLRLKKEVFFILNNKIRYYARQTLKLMAIMGTGFMIIATLIFVKYKPVYKVKFYGEDLGYIKDKQQMEETIKEFVNNQEGNIAFVSLDEMPEFEFEFASGIGQTNEEKLLENVKEKADITYRTYAISLNDEKKAYVNTIEEAQNLVEEIKAEYTDDIELNIGINEVYTENSFDIQAVKLEVAKQTLEAEVKTQIDLQDHGVNGILLSTPIAGQISSRFGSRWGSTHTGLDIAGSVGTEITACADGKVTFSGTQGGYGNLVIINHGNGVETYYAHCNSLSVTKGQEVKSGDIIATRGSTGNSTGPHLHLEIRINGVVVNPQNYLYK